MTGHVRVRRATLTWVAIVAWVAICPVAGAATIYSSSFEQPTYNAGNLIGQDGWSSLTSNVGRQLVIAGGTGGAPAATEGAQIAKIFSDGQNEMASRQWSATPVTGPFTISADIAYQGVGAVLYIQDDPAVFNGVIFGISGNQLYYRNGNTNVFVDADPVAGGNQPAATNTFYHFSATVDPAAGTWSLTITDGANNTVGNFTNLGIRNGVTQFDVVNAYVFANGDALFLDDLTFANVPEPATTSVVAAIAISGLAWRRRHR